MKPDDRVRLRHIVDALSAAIRFTERRSREDLDRDQMLAFAVLHAIQIVGEAAGKISAEFRDQHPQILWALITMSDALGTATELSAMKNYAGSRLSPWLGHLMISRQETARPLLTPGEVMQLPPDDELVLVSGCAPIRAKKARYFEDPELQARILPPPTIHQSPGVGAAGSSRPADFRSFQRPAGTLLAASAALARVSSGLNK